jgi:ribose 5-phosphate isomerase B
MERIVLAADHNGVALKALIKAHLEKKGYVCTDLGPGADQIKVDYPDYALQVANAIADGSADKGILMCGTGIGMSIMANRNPAVRAALVHNIESATKCREHNNANVLCLGAWINTNETNLAILDAWLAQPFGEGRHIPRVAKLSQGCGAGKTILTYGIFNILHPAHIELLKYAKSLGGRVVVGINSDRSVYSIKGEHYPVNAAEDRRRVIEAIGLADATIVFDETTPHKLIQAVHPDIVVKGDNTYTAEEIRVRDGIPPEIALKVFTRMQNYSSDQLLQKIKQTAYQPDAR